MASERRDRGMPQLSKRDRVSLTWVGEQYAIRFDSLQKLLGRMASSSYNPPAEPGKIARTNVYRVVKRWELLGLTGYQKFWKDEPGWVWLTNAGLRMQGLAFAPWSPRQGTNLQHLHVINEVRLRLEERYGEDISWLSERRLKKQVGELAARERTKRQIPDAVITVEGAQVAIQVELTPKSHKRTDGIVGNLVAQYDAVWYFVTEAAEPIIRHASRSQSKLKVYKLKEVLPLSV
jgi:hypothetical protein